MSHLSRIFGGISLFCICFSLPAFGQENNNRKKEACENWLTETQELYRNGQLHLIDLEGGKECLKLNQDYFSRASKQIILILLAQDQDTSARRLLVGLLKKNPEFFPLTSDPEVFRKLYSEYRTEPSMMYGAMIGGNLADPWVRNYYSIGNTQRRPPQYRSVTGYQYALHFAFQLSPKIFWRTGVSYSVRRFSYRETMDTDQDLGLNFTSLSLIEHQRWWNVPLGVQLHLPTIQLPLEGKLIPYVSTGVSGHVLLGPRFEKFRRLADNRNRIDPPITELTTEQEIVRIDQNRRLLDAGIYAGVGVMSKIKLGYFILDFRFRHGIRNLVNPAERYGTVGIDDISSIPYLFGYVDSDFIMRDFSLSIGYVKNIYQPELRRKFRQFVEQKK